MQPSLLEEIATVPNPYPIRSEIEYPEVWRLCEQARELAWNPQGIDFSDLHDADIPAEVRAAGAEWWSLRAWMEHGAVPYGAERLRDAVFGHQPFEIKQHVVNFIAEELRHHEASVLVAKNLAGYQDEPRADYFKAVIPRFHDERDEKAMSFFAGLAVNTLFEQLSGELLQARYENARFASIRTACQLILRDEARHIPVRPHRDASLLQRAVGRRPAPARREGGQEAARQPPQRRLRGGQPPAGRAQARRPQPRPGVRARPRRHPSRRRDRDHQARARPDPRGCRALRRRHPEVPEVDRAAPMH
jgi:hypothetical protein